MNRILTLCALMVVALTSAFAPAVSHQRLSTRIASFDTDEEVAPATGNRGVSVDQDGKSNVWAIEPKMEVSNKSSEETGKSAIIAGGGLAVMVAAAAVILTNLPDPNQF